MTRFSILLITTSLFFTLPATGTSISAYSCYEEEVFDPAYFKAAIKEAQDRYDRDQKTTPHTLLAKKAAQSYILSLRATSAFLQSNTLDLANILDQHENILSSFPSKNKVEILAEVIRGQYLYGLLSGDWTYFQKHKEGNAGLIQTNIYRFKDFLTPRSFLLELGYINALVESDPQLALNQIQKLSDKVYSAHQKIKTKFENNTFQNTIGFYHEEYGRYLLQTGWILERIHNKNSELVSLNQLKNIFFKIQKTLPQPCANPLRALAYQEMLSKIKKDNKNGTPDMSASDRFKNKYVKVSPTFEKLIEG